MTGTWIISFLFTTASIEAAAADPLPILGGEVVGPCGWPNVVSVGGFCSGTLIHPEVVLYAAHCGEDVPWIRFADTEDGPSREVVPERCAIHPVGSFGFGTDFAACILADPVTDVPITPPLMGCDAEAKLVVGESATIVGFGQSDDPEQPFGIKRQVTTEIVGFSWDEVFVGNENEGACYGDSGGPALVQLDDGTWRVFGVTSWGQPGCGAGNYFPLVHNGIDWIETETGIDVTPCHDGFGYWDPSPACEGFATGDPGSADGTWDSCTFGQVSGPSSTCGPAFDPSPDTTAPAINIVDPYDGARYNTQGDDVELEVEVAVEDVGWGTELMVLRVVDGETVLFELEDNTAPFTFPAFSFPTGVWTLEAEATDRAGNVGTSERVTFGVNTDPPQTDDDTDTDTDADTDVITGDPETSDSTVGSTGTAEAGTESTSGSIDDGGCSCRSTTGDGSAAALGLLAIAGLCRRRRRAGFVAIAGLLFVSGCTDPTATTGNSQTTDGETTSDTTDGTTTDDTTDATANPWTETDGTTDTETTGLACGNGQVEEDELCDDGNSENADGCNNDCIPSGSEVWRTYIPGPGNVGINALEFDGAGDIIAAGYSDRSGEGFDAWLAKFTVDGDMVWEHTHAGAAGNTTFRDVTIDADTIVAVGLVENEELDSLIASYDSSGSPVSVDERSLDADQDVLIDVVVGGDQLIALALVGPEATPNVTAFDTNLDVAWTFSAPDGGSGGTLARTPDGHTLAAIGVPKLGEKNLQLAKLDDSGAVKWTRTISDPLTYYHPNDVAIKDDGNAIICGELSRTQAADVLLVAVDPNGNQQWKDRYPIPGPGNDWCNRVTFTSDNSIAFVGTAFTQTLGWEAWVGKVDATDGTLRWSRTLGGDGVVSDAGGAILGLPNGGLIVGASIQVDGSHRTLIRLTP